MASFEEHALLKKNFLQPNFLQISLFVFFLYENSTYQESTVINDMAFFKAIEKVYPKKKVYTENKFVKTVFYWCMETVSDSIYPVLSRIFIVLKKISWNVSFIKQSIFYLPFNLFGLFPGNVIIFGVSKAIIFISCTWWIVITSFEVVKLILRFHYQLCRNNYFGCCKYCFFSPPIVNDINGALLKV